MAFPSSISPIHWIDDQLVLMDQRYLPEKNIDFICDTLEQAASAISDLVVRGAPAIGITAAYAVCLGYRQSRKNEKYDLDGALNLLRNARPTAVNLAWAVDLQNEIIQSGTDDIESKLLSNAQTIHQQDVLDNQKMGDLGADLIQPGSRVLTHCNAGALATAGYGTALGVIRSAWGQHKLDKVFASETRPWQQGLRLTAWELAEDDIPVTVIVEGAASSLLSRESIDWIIVGADRICANGDVINKVGTANLAIMAQRFGVKVMVAAPLSTIDMNTASGDLVEIEYRAQNEILAENYSDNNNVSAWNPVFDVTPAELVSAIITERAVVHLPNEKSMRDMVNR